MQTLSYTPAASEPRFHPAMTTRRSHAVDTDRLSRDEEAVLIRRAQAGDKKAMDRLIRASIRLVYRVTRRYRCRSLSQEDLVQEGVMGLMIAVERFDLSQGYRLSTYALHWIRQSVARAVNQYDQMIHVPLQVTADARRLDRLAELKQHQLGRLPDEMELATEAGLPEERVAKLSRVSRDVVSLEAMAGPDQDSWLTDRTVDESAVNPEADAVWGMYRQHLRTMIGRLNSREQIVVRERFGLENGQARTLDELSQRLGVSRERVRQIETRAIQKLRYALREGQWDL